MELNGNGSYAILPHNAAQRSTGQLTVEGWFRYDSLNNFPHLVSKPLRDSPSNSYALWYQGSLRVGYQPVGGGFASYDTGYQPQLGVWTHYAMVLNTDDSGVGANTMKLYVNGVEVFSGVAGNPIYYNGVNDSAVPHPLLIGADYENNSPSFFLDGGGDEISIYGRALTQAEIFGIVQQGSYGKCLPETCIPAGTVSWYPGEGDASDVTSRYPGMNAGATFTTGKVGQAFNFNGSGSYVSFGSSAGSFGTSDCAVDFWMKTSTTRQEAIVSKRNGCASGEPAYFSVRTTANGARLDIELDNAAGQRVAFASSRVINDGVFHHVAVQRSGNSLQLYIDGALDSSATGVSGINLNNAGQLAIAGLGCAGIDGTATYTGVLDEVSFYGQPLSGAEVQAIFNAGSNGKCGLSSLPAPANQNLWFTGDGTPNSFAGTGAGTLRGDAKYAIGKVGQAFSFDGDGDYLEVPDAPDQRPANDITVEGWFKLASLSGTPHLISKPLVGSDSNSYVIWYDAGQLRGGHGNQSGGFETLFTGFSPHLNTWYHFAYTVDDAANIHRFFVNGVEIANAASNLPLYYDANPHPLLVGAEYGTTPTPIAFLNGEADEVSLYSAALSTADIQAIYNAGVAGKTKAKATPAGSNVQTQLSDATVTFASVSAAGATSQHGIDLGSLPSLPGETVFTGLAYELSTTATYQSGSANDVGVCFNIPGLANWTFSKLRILHLENGVWVDRTLRQGTAPTLCTQGLTSLSPFVIVQVEPPFDEIPDAVTAEDTAVTIPFTLTNPEGVTSLTASSGNVTVVPNDAAHINVSGTGANRTLRITPAANEFGTAPITITVTRASGSASDGFTLTVTDVNDAPVVTLDSLGTVAEDSGAITISKASLLTNDAAGPANESGQTVSFVSATAPVGGTITVTDTDVTFTPAANFYGQAGFSYTVQDNGTSNGASDPRTSAPGGVRFTITEINEAPTAVADTLSAIAEDSGVRTIPFGTLTSNDPRGPENEGNQSLVVASVGNAVGGTVAISNGNVLFTPTADFNGPAGFSYTVQDNGTTNGSPDPLTSGAATVSFTITEVNDAPVASNDSLAAVAEDSGARTITLAELIANDSRGPANESSQTLTIVSVANAANGTVSISGADVVFTPNEHYHGPVSFTYVVRDNGTTNSVSNPLTSAAATVSYIVYEVNDVPVANNDSLATIAEDAAPLTIPFAELLANDSRGPESESNQALTVSSVADGAGGTVEIIGTDVIFTPAADFNGIATFTYTAADDGMTNGATEIETSEPATVSFTVTEVNDAPIASADPLSAVVEDSGARTIAISSLLANDVAGPENESSETFALKDVSGAIGGTAVISGGNVVFTPAEHFNGVASFTYTIKDKGTTTGVADPRTSTPGTVSFTVTEVNDAPAGSSDALPAIAEDSTARTIAFADLLVNDSRGPANENDQTLTVSSVSAPVGGTVSISAGDVIFTPTADYYGPAGFSYVAQDNGTTNGAPDPLTSTAVTVSFTITEVNDGPTAANDALSAIAEDSGQRTIAFADLLANDSRGPANEGDQTVTLASVSSPVGGTVTISGTNVIFAPTKDFNGKAGFAYTIQDNGTTAGGNGSQTSAPASVTFTVTEVNDVPVTTSDSLSSISEGTAQRVIAAADLLGNDSQGAENENEQTLVVSRVTSPVGGTVELNGGEVIFTPASDFNGAASFSYTTQDDGTTNGAPAAQSSAPATVSFIITQVNDAPTAASDSLSGVLEDSGARAIPFADLTANDSRGPANEDDQTLTVNAVGDAVGGTVAISNGRVIFTPAANFNGIASFSYTVQDNGTTNGANDFLASAPATASFTVTAVNDAPTFSLAASPAAINEDSGAQAIENFASNFQPGPASATDEGSQTLVAYNVVVTEKTGSLSFTGPPTISNAGQLAYAVAPNTSGTATISVTATDSGSGTAPNVNTSAPQIITITVNPVNDAPSFTKGVDLTVNGEAGAQTIAAWATGIFAGAADEATQTVAFTTTSNNTELFTIQPAVAPDGQLTYTPANTKAGTATVSVFLTDNGGTANSGQDTSAVQTFTITVFDATPPVFSNVPADMTVEATSSKGAPVSYTAPTANDRVSGDVAVTCTPAAGSTFALGTTAVTCAATDAAGNRATEEFDVTVRDTTAPEITNVPADIKSEATSPSGAAVTFAKPTAQDTVSGTVPVSCVPPSGSTFALGTTTVTCSASDLAGNKATKTFNVTVQDTTAPTIRNTPANITAEATSANGAAVTYTNPTATDVVDSEPTVTCAPASGTTFALGATTVTCTAQDDAGNSSSSTFTVTVQDKTAPTITAPDEVVAEATAADGATVSFITSATDAVTPDVAVTCTPASGTKFALGSTTVTCSATDAAGNRATDTFPVIVRDTKGPTFTGVPADITVEATSASGATATYTAPTAEDAVSGTATVTCTPASGSTFAVGTTTATCSAKDAADNAGTATFKVLVRDTTAPVFAKVPANITAEATGPNGAAVTYSAPTASDTVDAAVTVTCTPVSGSTFALGSTTVTCTAQDKAANQATATFSVAVRDTKAPTFSSAPANVTREATGPDGAAVSYTNPPAEDVVGATVTCAPASGSTFALGNSTVTCTARDAAGNQATTTFTVTVVDTTAPVISAPADMVVYNDAGQNGALVTFTVTATDAVDRSIKPTLSHPSGSFFPIGTTEVTATAVDTKGNQAAPKKFKVTVRRSEMANISTRAPVGTGENVLIGGFISMARSRGASWCARSARRCARTTRRSLARCRIRPSSSSCWMARACSTITGATHSAWT